MRIPNTYSLVLMAFYLFVFWLSDWPHGDLSICMIFRLNERASPLAPNGVYEDLKKDDGFQHFCKFKSNQSARIGIENPPLISRARIWRYPGFELWRIILARRRREKFSTFWRSKSRFLKGKHYKKGTKTQKKSRLRRAKNGQLRTSRIMDFEASRGGV